MIKKYKLPIGHLFTFLNISDEYEIPVAINRFLAIKTLDGFKKINFLIKKQGNIFKYTLENGIELLCDENHLVKDLNSSFKFIKDCDIIQTIDGDKKIINSQFIKFGDVFDMSIDAPYEYLTASGIICHNTTLAKILAMNLNCDVKYINASDENSIDDVRTKVKGFASTTGFKDLKIMILDECLDENTLVTILRDGIERSVKIKDLNDKTDLVKSYNLELNEIQYRPFDLHNIGQSEVYELELENGEVVICTDTHKWYVEDENCDTILVKTKDIISGKYDYILTE